MVFFSDNAVLFSLAFFVCGVIAFLITLIRTGSIKKSINSFIEVFEMKYKTVDDKKSSDFKQSFSKLVDDYIYNPDTKLLEVLPSKKDLQAYINSHLDCALERALEKFLPNVVNVDDSVVEDYSRSKEDLAVLAQSMELAEDYRDKFGLSDNCSVADIYAKIDEYAKNLKVHLSSVRDKKLKKEGENNGKGSQEEIKS